MTVYFSVDVETTGPMPGFGELLSVGICTLNGHDDNDMFYRTVKHKYLHFDPSTLDWWLDQDRRIWAAARELESQVTEHELAHILEDWIESQAPDKKSRCFVANPVAFDWPWLNHLFFSHLGRNPFGYRALCIRSMHYGMTDTEWGSEREEWGEICIEPEIPHHALYDARAQREELRLLLNKRN